MDSTNLKQQLIEEVARVQRTNLRRVESSSGMKTIYSSENYRMSKSGQHGNQKPGRSRVKKKNPDHKIISADLFENHAQTSIEVETAAIQTTPETSDRWREIQADNMIRGTSPNESETEKSKRMSSMSDRAESEMTLPETTIRDAVGMSRVESQLSEEDHAIQALVSLVETQEARLDEVESGNVVPFEKEREESVTIGASVAPPLPESVQFTQTTEAQPGDSQVMQSLVAKARKQLVEEETNRKPIYIPLVVDNIQDKVTDTQNRGRNLEDINSFFDLKEIISSTPQAGSMYEGTSTPSEIGSVYSGTGSRLDRVESGTWQGSRLVPTKENRDAEMSLQSGNYQDVSQDMGTHLLISPTASLGTFETRERGSGSPTYGAEDVNPQMLSVVENVQATHTVTRSTDSEGSSGKEEETHLRFNPMLADLSSSMEEDFTTSKKVVGTELSSSAEVIVHSDHVHEEDNSFEVPSNVGTSTADIRIGNEMEEDQQSLNRSVTSCDIPPSHDYAEHHALTTTGITNMGARVSREELSSSAEVILPSDQMSEISSKRTSLSIESPRMTSSDQSEVEPQQFVETIDIGNQSRNADSALRPEQVRGESFSKQSSPFAEASTGDSPDRIELEPHTYPISMVESTELSSIGHIEVRTDQVTKGLASGRLSSSEETLTDGSSAKEVEPIQPLDILVSDNHGDKDRFHVKNLPTVKPVDPVLDSGKRLNVHDEIDDRSVSTTTTRTNHSEIKQEMDFDTESLDSQNENGRGESGTVSKEKVFVEIEKDECELEQDLKVETVLGREKDFDQTENGNVLQLKAMAGSSNIAGTDTTLTAGHSQVTRPVRLAPIGAEKEDLRKYDLSSNSTSFSVKNDNTPEVNTVTLMASTLERINRSHSASSIGSKSDQDDVWTSSGGLPTESQPRKYSTVTENNKSDMKTISDMVDVKSLAKQLETVLDFKKMMRLHSNSEQIEDKMEQNDARSRDRPVKRILGQAQDPKNAFGQVLTEIFQKTRLRSVQYDSDTPDSSMNTSEHERVADTQNISVTRTGEYDTISDTQSIGHIEAEQAAKSRVYISTDTVVGDNELPVPPAIEIDQQYNKLQTQSAVKLTLPENKTETLPEKPRYADYYVNNPANQGQNPPIFSPSEHREESPAHDTDYRIETDEKRDVWGSATVTKIIVNRKDPQNTEYLNQSDTDIHYRRERPISLENPYVWDYNPQRDASSHVTLSESLITAAEENPHVTSLRQRITRQTETDGKGYEVETFGLEREHFEPEDWGGINSGVLRTNEVTSEGALTFQTKSPVDAGNRGYTNTSDTETTQYSSGEEEAKYTPEYSGQKTTSTVYVSSQPGERPATNKFSREDDTVQGSLFYQRNGPIETDNSGLRSAVRYQVKPAQPLRQYDINIEKKEDRSGHMTFSSSGYPEHAIKRGFDHPVTTQQKTGEGIFGEDEKLLNSGLRSNYTSESRSGKQTNRNRATNYSLFYDGNDDGFSVLQRPNDEVTGDFIHQGNYRDRSPAGTFHSTSVNKYNTNKNMAYLLTGKEHLQADYNRSGRSTPQRKDLAMQEDILVSPTAADDRRGSHGSTNYLADKQAGQDFFHFRAPGNGDRESEVRGERMQREERKEQRVLTSGRGDFEPLPDTYIGRNAPEPVPIRIQVNGDEIKPETVSQTSSVSHHGSRASSDRGRADSTDGKKHKSEHKRTERVTKTVISSQSHNGSQTSDRTDYPRGYQVVRVDSLDPNVRRRERRDIKVTSTNETKARGDDNISISSASSQSSSSVAEALNSFDAAINSGSRHNVSPDNRRAYSETSDGVQKVRVDYDPNTSMYTKGNSNPQQFVKVKDYRIHREDDHEKRPQVHGRENGSAKDVQHLIKSLEKETRRPHRPIPGVDRDAFSYHVTSSGNENNNRVNEVDVTTREAMRDRGNSGKGSSQVIKRYTEEKIVEDVTPEASLHVAAEPGGHGGRTIVLQNGQPSNRNIVFHPPASVDRSDSDRAVRFNDSRDSIKRDKHLGGETSYYVETSGAPHGRSHTENVKLIKKERTDKSHRRRHSLSSSDSGSSDSEGERGRKPKSGSPTQDDKHVTTVSFDESFNRKRSASPSSEDAYKSKVHVKKHHVVKTERVRSADSDNELYVRSSRSSPYRVVSPHPDVHNVTVKGTKHRRGRGSDSDGSTSDNRMGSHRSTINISKSPEKRRSHEAPAVLSIPLTREPVAMTIPAMHETKYVTNKSEKVELKRSSSLDSIRDMVDNDSDKYRSEKVLHLGSSSDAPSSPEMRSPNSPYVSTITILNRKLNVKDPNGDSGTGTEVISSDDDIRYRSQLRPVREEVVYATKEAPRSETKQRRSEKHTKTYSSYDEIRNDNNYEYVVPKHKTAKIREERRIPIREEYISPIQKDRARTVRETLHERLSNMSYEQSQEPQRVEQSTVDSDMKVVRGQFVIRNSMDISLDEDDSLALDDNINIFDNSFTLNKENPLYQSDPDLYKKFESETVEERARRIKDPVHVRPESVQRVTQVHVRANPSRDEVDAQVNNREREMYSSRERNAVRRVRRKVSPSSGHRHYFRNDLDVPYAEGDFGDGFEDIIKNTRATAVKSAPNKKKQNLSALLLSRLAQIDSKDITQHIDVEHHNEEIYGDISFIHADGSKTGAEDTTNFDSVSEHIDLMLKEGKAMITIKVTAERIIPIDYEFNVWRKSQAIVTRNIEIDLKANDQRRRLYEHVMDTTPSKMIGSSSSRGYGQANEAVLSSKDTLKLFSRLLSVAEKDDKAIEKDEVLYETQHRERSDSLPSLSNADMLY